jgi:hypothetical protein
MAQLLIAAAVNIAVGLLINELFPPPDIEQEGPRLTELGFTSAAYGKMVNIVFGTDRIPGNIIDSTDPPIEEVVTKESQSAGGKGGGQQVNTTTYTYFLTCRIAWCIEGADELVRLWGDGKIIIDATGTGQLVKEGVLHTFYPGGIDQLQDPEEVTRRDANIPAYGHLTTSKLDRMPLADYGNRIPNFTAEISFNATVSTPFLQLDPEPAGFNPPGSLTGADATHMMFNPDRNEVYGLKGGSLGTWAADASTMDFKFAIGGGGDGTITKEGFGYSNGTGNTEPMLIHDIETGVQVQSYGRDNVSTGDHANGAGVEPDYEGTGSWSALTVTIPGIGVREYVAHLADLTAQNGSITGVTGGTVAAGSSDAFLHQISSADDVHPTFGDPGNQLSTYGEMIPDHDRGVFYYIGPEAPTATFYRMVEFKPTQAIGIGGIIDTGMEVRTVRTFTIGTDINGTGTVKGWAVNRVTGDIMWTNGTEVMLYNPLTDTILARTSTGASSFDGTNNYYSGSIFAWMSSSQTGGTLWIFDTRTLEVIRSVPTNTIGWPTTGGPNETVILTASQVWDDRVQAIYLSRVDLGSDAPVDARVLKVFVNRVGVLGVGLDTVVSALSTSYQRQKMAGLLAADIDVTTLAGDTVPGYSLTRQSTMKSALQPLRDRYLFDAHQSDWKIKFPKRGAASVLTIPEEDVGILKRGRSMTDEPAVREIRQDDLSLPMSLAVRYRNKDTDYQIDIERDKRHLFPNPTMRSKSERTLDIPIVETATNMKQLAQKTLLTLWNERVSYKTIVPWTYIKLDATDVFSMGVFNETHQLRMAENDLGQGWAIELTGVVEDTKSFSSTLAGGLHGGHVGTTVPSSLPTRLFPFDAPILSNLDILLTPLSNAYMIVGAFEDGWPGATVMKSLDDVAYVATGTVNVEAAIAKVRTAPGAWNIVNGDAPNRWQEVADGGTMVVTPLRRADVWATATELNVLSGANAVGVIRASDGQVEVLNFVNATLNDNNTVTLTRLLRGRLGTEDIADLGITAGDTCVLMSNELNVKDDGPILRQNLTLSELDTETFFKGVTVGTLIEDAPVISATYTGRDVKPYFVADIRGVSDGAGGLDISWARRARGPLAAEWLDGTGTVVLNEGIERYEVTLSTAGNPDFITKTVDDIEFVNFTNAEVLLGGTSGGFARGVWPNPETVQGDFEGGTINVFDQPIVDGGWVNIDSPTGWYWRNSGPASIPGPPVDARISPASTSYLGYNNNTSDSQRTVRNTIDLITHLGLTSAQIPTATAKANIWCAQNDDADSCDVWFRVLNAGGTSLASVQHLNFRINPSQSGVNLTEWCSVGSLNDATLDPWPQRDLTLTLDQPGAAQLAFDCGINKGGTTLNQGNMAWDHLEVEVLVPPPGITVRIQMISETGLKSPLISKQVT